DLQDKSALGFGVRLPIFAISLRELALQGGIATGDPWVPTKPIAEVQLVAISLRSHWDEVEVMGASSRIWLAEPVHLLGQVWRIAAAEVGQRPNGSTCG